MAFKGPYKRKTRAKSVARSIKRHNPRLKVTGVRRVKKGYKVYFKGRN